jgi:hypothetical protein
MADPTFIEQLRQELPRLLREHPEMRHELMGMMLEGFPSRQEFMALIDELREAREETNQRFAEQQQESNRRFEALRQEINQRFAEQRQEMNQRFEAVDRRFEAMLQEMNQRFEAVDRRFEAVDRRFEAVDRRFEAILQEMNQRFAEQRQEMNQRFEAVDRRMDEMTVHLSSLGARVGYGLEHMVRSVVEEFAGQTFPLAERLMLLDDTGAVFGVPGAEVEFDLYARNGTAYLVEVKSHVKTSDVTSFYQKVRFAETKLGRQVTPLIIALSMERGAEQQMRRLGVKYRIRAIVG